MKNPLALLSIVLLLIVGYLYSETRMLKKESASTKVPSTNTKLTKTNCIPTFRDGGGPYYKANAPFRRKIAPNQNGGEKLFVRGKVLNSDCSETVGNAVIDIWQANESGNYEDDWYRGQVRSHTF